VNGFLRSDLGAQLPLHISLSAPLVLTTSQKVDFQSNFERSLTRTPFRTFCVNPTSLAWVSNFEKTRFFLVLRLSRPKDDQLNRLLDLSNECATQFHLPLLYKQGVVYAGESANKNKRPERKAEDSSSAFHISIAWTLQEPSEDERATVQSVILPSELAEKDIRFDTVKLKIGNVVNDITLV